ncbi:MAG: translation initiation factor IF-2 [SAR324 cluster bacterium]|nr:translation initiation factor IF-2 [SAR324 cluster bacterium]
MGAGAATEIVGSAPPTGRQIGDAGGGDPRHTFAPRRRAIRLGQNITVSELAGVLGVKAPDIIKRLMVLGVMATVNDSIEGATAELIGSEFNVPIELDTTNIEDFVKEEPVDESQLKSRPPIVTVMGHVDHGKTSLLDHIRETQVADREAGGITQHIGASLVKIEAGSIVFVDTPGHEAFTSMRARGANITDLVVLVVAADDGVMPQTTEAIEHARAANVPIMVAINKMDRPNADVEKIKRQLMEHELLAEELGGETIMVPVSAKTGEGVAHLLEMIQLQAEIMELKTTPEGPARGFIIEARMDRRRGPVATVIVRRGTLQPGDYFVAGSTQGRVRAIFDDRGQPVNEAGPSHPVEILGYDELPEAGDELVVVPEEKIARQIAAGRANRKQEGDSVERRRMHLEDFIQGVESAEEDTLNVVLKADAHGPLEAIRSALEKQGNAQARARVIRGGVGGISENDISLAATTNAVVIGFNVRPEAKAGSLARSDGVDVKLYTVIYELIEDVRKALEGLLKPIVREEVIGHCEVRQIFSVSKEGQIAGGFITDGRLERNGLVRLYRDNVLIHSGTISSLRRFKEDVAQVNSGYECGVRIAKFTDIQEGDYIESYVQVEEAQTLDGDARQ